MRRSTEGERLDDYLVTGADPASEESQMYGCRTGRQGHNLLVSADELLQVVFKPVDIGTQGYHPVGIESLLDEFLLLARHVSQA